MHIEVYARHSSTCAHKSDRFYRKCRCRKWLYIVGRNKRISAGTRSWEQAERSARELAFGDSSKPPIGEQSVHHATRAFIEDKAQQSLSKNWQRKLSRELEDFARWCDGQVMLRLSDITLHGLEQY